MFQHVNADYPIEGGIVTRKRLAHANLIIDAQIACSGVAAGGGDRLGGGIDAGYKDAPRRHRLGHKASSAPKIEDVLLRPVEETVEPCKPRRHQVLQSPYPAQVIRPPAVGNL